MKTARFNLELGGSMAGYMVLLVVSIGLLRHDARPGALTTAIAVMPMLPALGVGWAVMRHLRRLDEMQRRVQLESLGIAFMATAFITFTYGFLENAGFPRLSMFVVWPLMAALWVASCAVCQRRYA